MEFLAKDIGIVLVFVTTAWMLKTYLSHRERMKGLSVSTKSLASTDQRLERVEQAVESIAIEIERIGEGQRYVTNLLSERPQHVSALPMPVSQSRQISDIGGAT